MINPTKIFLIAEIGINHNGDLNIAKELIKNAKLAGFDSVKFQKRDIELVYTKEFLDSPRESQWGITQRDQKKGLEFSFEQFQEIDRYCNDIKIEWFASAWDINSQKFLQNFNCKYNKVFSKYNYLRISRSYWCCFYY
jgi:N-acetylneuraminate synthase